jgi:hypothetical protein
MPDNFEFEDGRAFRHRRRELRRQWRSSSGGIACRRSPAGRVFFAVFLIIAGVALFLDNVGVLRLRNIWEYSPLLMCAWGISVLSGAPSIARRYWGILLIVLGVLGLLLNLGVLRLHTRDDSWLLALLLIAGGIFALIKTIEGGARPAPRVGFPTQTASGSDDVLDEHAVFGSLKRKVETANFLGGQIECVFGSVDLDLRYSQIAPNSNAVRVDVKCVFGSAKLRIPDTWMVTLDASGVFGNVEDKTIPPRTGAGPGTPTLMITGESVFSSVEVEN